MKPLYVEEHRKPWLLFLPCYFKIYEDKVEAYFWPYRHIIPISKITEIKVIERIPWCVGWGLRIDPFERKLYFAIHHGKSVEIRKKDGLWRSVVLSTKDPEKFVSTIRKLLPL